MFAKKLTWLAIITAAAAAQQPREEPHESLGDAWWTGPMLAPSANTLPSGHFLLEPYLYDVITEGARVSVPHANGFGSLTYALYGLANKFTVLGMIPTLEDVSVYGTGQGFRGRAHPGSSLFLDLAAEYSMTQRWVLALDATYRHQGNTLVKGYNVAAPPNLPISLNSGTGDAFGFAPAIEYNWKSNLGVLLGTRLFPAGRNTALSITPAIAINYVR